jgi:hypothetical protein
MFVKSMTKEEIVKHTIKDFQSFERLVHTNRRFYLQRYKSSKDKLLRGQDPWSIWISPSKNKWYIVFKKKSMTVFTYFNGMIIQPVTMDFVKIRTRHFFERYDERLKINDEFSMCSLMKKYFRDVELKYVHTNKVVEENKNKMIRSYSAYSDLGIELGTVVENDNVDYCTVNTFVSKDMFSEEQRKTHELIQRGVLYGAGR